MSSLRSRPAAELGRALILALFALALADAAHASCNVIPAATQDFRGALGSSNRSFASPDDYVEVRVRPAICDDTSTGFVDLDGDGSLSDDHVVTVIFAPLGGGPKNAVVLAESCAAVNLASCTSGQLGGGSVECVQVNGPGDPPGIVVTDAGQLQVRFPDTDALLATGGCPGDSSCDDDRTFSGPAKIVVTRRGAALQCGVASSRCALLGGTTATNGVVACLDEFFVQDGTCRTTPGTVDPIFGHFTALPPPNDVEQMINAPGVTEVHFTTDAAGHVLLPMDYAGVLLRVEGVPVPQLLRATTDIENSPGSGTKIDLPSSTFVSSYSPEGVVLPPVFTPLSDASSATDAILFGSADAPRSVLRLTRRGCVGGTDAGRSCWDDAHCSSNDCGDPLFDFSTRYASSVGPVLLAAGGGYTAVLDSPISLESLAQAKAGDTFAFVTSEAVDAVDRNGDDDDEPRDLVVTLRDPATGEVAAIGPGDSDGRATLRVQPFGSLSRIPAVETEGDLVGFLESEVAQGGLDTNGNDDVFGAVLRLFRLDPGGATDLTPSAPPTVFSGYSVINGRPAAFTDASRLLFLTGEPDHALQTTARVSESTGGGEPNDVSESQALGTTPRGPQISSSGRYVVFNSVASDIIVGDTNGLRDIFLRDRDDDVDGIFDEPGAVTVERISVATGGAQATGGGADEQVVTSSGRYVAFVSAATNLDSGGVETCGGPPGTSCADIVLRDRVAGTTERVSLDTSDGEPNNESIRPSISADGRFVAFETIATDIVAGDTNGARDVFVRDRCESNGNSVPSCTPHNVRVSVDSNGAELSGPSEVPSISADGRVVAFMNGGRILAHDRDADGDGAFDEPGAIVTEVVTLSVGGAPRTGQYPSVGVDGRWVAFESSVSDLVPGDTNSDFDVFVRDRLLDVTQRVSVASDGAQAQGISAGVFLSSLSAIAFWSTAPNLVPGDENALMDVFVHDAITRTTRRVSVSSSGDEADALARYPSVSLDGRFVTFESDATTLVSGDGAIRDVFVRGLDTADAAADLSGDGILDDLVLRVVDASVGPPAEVTDLCPVVSFRSVAAAGGRAAFARPESAGATTNPECTGASLTGPDLNGDGDETDQVVHLWDGSDVSNLRCPAWAVDLSPDLLAALVSEGDEGAIGTQLNGDADVSDLVLHVRDPAAAAGATCASSNWTNTGLAGDAGQTLQGRGLAVSGERVAILSSESSESAMDLNGDGDTADIVVRLVDGATGLEVPFEDAQGDPLDPPAASEFVLGDALLAFRVPEAAQSNASAPDCSLNGDDDCNDAVLQVVDLATARLVSSGQAALRCELAECDARHPYRVSSDTVRFLTLESQQHDDFPFCDLNDDGDCGDLLVQVLNVQSGETRVVAEVAEPDPAQTLDPTAVPGSDPLAAPSEDDPAQQSSQLVVAEGRCVEDSEVECTMGVPGECPGGRFCFAPVGETEGSCVRDTGLACHPDAAAAEQGCLAGAECVRDLTVLAIADRDADQIADALDNCPDGANTDQVDADQDGVGNPCDLQTCGDGFEQLDEECDDGDLDSGDGCDANCTDTGCGNGIVTAGETCDDGNALDGDGCSFPACQIETACSDTVDNDGDGGIDAGGDLGCANAADDSETNPAFDCDDGEDNDDDGLTDSGEDMGCFSAGSMIENPQCQDGIQNDFDGLIDWDGGASALVPPGQQTSPDPDCVGRPYRDREKTGAACGLGFEVAFAMPPLAWLRGRRRRRTR